ncbi:VWA domain-containing protein [Rossellomorea sp. NS-SX7]|uniref:VWA domain-containing protein n=1 Tax=Rossellomorea sp. NS-SX7 TaxID=3463856 RepID=UPI004058EDCC
MRKRILFVFASALLLLTGCSENEPVNNTDSEKAVEHKQSEEKKEELNREDYTSTTVEDVLVQPPGKYSGEQYNEDKVKAQLDKLPKDLTKEEYFQSLLALTAEDYQGFKEFFDGVDISYEEASTVPGESTTDMPGGKQVNVSILFDSSGSMNGKIGSKTKMELAKDSIQSFVSSLPEQVNVSLRVYGHKGTGDNSDKELSCGSSEVVYPLAAYEKERFNQALSSFSPAGWTPLAASIHSAGEDLKKQTGENVENIVYVVSDGVETCDGDPVAKAQELNDSDIAAIVNIIGFDVDNDGQKALKQVAEAGKGKYETVKSKQEFDDFFEKEKNRLIDEWFDWENENVDKYFKSETERVGELFDQETKMVDLAQDEENRLLDLSMYLESKVDEDFYDVRELIRDRGYSLREYARNTAYEYREELRNKGYENREKARDKGYEEREKLRNE